MWVFQNDSSLSVVAHRHKPGFLLVRSRIEGDIQRAIPGAEVFEDLKADYRFRSAVSVDDFKAAMTAGIDKITYDNFKGSISHDDEKRHSAYMGVWKVMATRYGSYGQSGSE